MQLLLFIDGCMIFIKTNILSTPLASCMHPPERAHDMCASQRRFSLAACGKLMDVVCVP